jgi:hypothetical protein
MRRSSFAFILSGGVDRFSSRSFALALAPAACHDLFGAVFSVAESQDYDVISSQFWSIANNV